MPSPHKHRLAIFAAGAAVLTLSAWSLQTSREAWPVRMARDLGALERDYAGEFGVYAIDLRAKIAVNFKADQKWDLSGVLDTCIAAKLLEDAEAGRIRLTDRMQVRRSDIVTEDDGLAAEKSGSSFTTEDLMRRMLEDHDRTAADMLIRKAGPSRVGAFCQERIAGLGRLLDHKSERREVYAEFHRQARGLTNWDFIELSRVPAAGFLDALARKLYVGRSFLRVRTVDEAFERYYKRDFNQASMAAMGMFLDALLGGRILSSENTALINRMLEARKSPPARSRRICGVRRLRMAVAFVCFRGGAGVGEANEAWERGLQAVSSQL